MNYENTIFGTNNYDDEEEETQEAEKEKFDLPGHGINPL